MTVDAGGVDIPWTIRWTWTLMFNKLNNEHLDSFENKQERQLSTHLINCQ